MSALALQERPDAAEVLARAVVRVVDKLGMSQRDLAAVLGVSAATASRLARGQRGLEPSTKEGELALLLIRAFRGLDALVGGDEAKARAWFKAHNDHLGGIPGERVRSVQGLVDVVTYLDAMRGRF